MALKVADLGHLASELEVHKQWVSRLEEVSLPVSFIPDPQIDAQHDPRPDPSLPPFLFRQELFRQGDREKSFGLAVSPLMDRTKSGVTKSQCGFYNVVALPLFKVTVRGQRVSNLISLMHRQLKIPSHRCSQTFTEVFPRASAILANLERNFNVWSKLESEDRAAAD